MSLGQGAYHPAAPKMKCVLSTSPVASHPKTPYNRPHCRTNEDAAMTFKFTCDHCGEVHEGSPNLAFNAPDY
jgi:hypothetical protein